VLDQVLATLISRGLVHLFGDIPSLLTAA
jgi:hypothetical protein